MLEKIRVSDYIIKFIEDIGVDTIFMVPGGGAMYLNDALYCSKHVNHIANHHEQASVIAAEAYSRVTDNIGVAMVTSGPGATNAITGVAGAFIDSIPLIILSGQVKTNDLKKESGLRQKGPQEVDIVKIVSSITKFAVTISKPSDIKKILPQAFKIAISGRKGPVWVDVPLDIQASYISNSKINFTLMRKTGYSPKIDSVKKTVALLKKSERPLFFIGTGARLSGCKDLLKVIINKFPFAFLTTWNAMDLIPYNSKKNFGKPGSVALRPANFVVQNCDLLVCIGTRLDNVVTGFNIKGFAREAKKIVIDIDQNELNKFSNDDFFKILSDAKLFLQKLVTELKTVSFKKNKEWLLKCNSWKDRYGLNDGKPFKDYGSISHAHIVDTLSNKISSNTLIVTGSSGLGVEAFYVYFRNKINQRIFHTTGLGAMGYCLPAIIGSHYANKRKKIVAIEGDGSLQMNIQELAVIKGLKIPVTIFIFDNNGYASIRNTQNNYFKGNQIATDKKSKLYMPDLEKILKSHNISYKTIKKIEEMEKTVDSCLNKNYLNVCIIKLKQNDILQPKIKNIPQSDGTLKSMPLEDLSPMLSRKVLKKEMIIPLHKNSINIQEL